MKKIYFFAAALMCLAACGDGLDLPPVGVETDLDKITLPNSEEGSLEVPLKAETEPMIHDGALHSAEDFARVRQNLTLSPWKEGYEKLCRNSHAQVGYNPRPTEIIVRGGGVGENYMQAANDAAAAYQLGLRWKITGEAQYADRAVYIMNTWAAICKSLGGDSNVSLGAGIYGFEFAVAGELLRDYEGWASDDFKAYQDWMLNVFYPANNDFLVRHHGTPDGHYWANWGLCNVASIMAIGILADRRDLYNEAIEHFQIGKTNGCINKAIYHVFDGDDANLAQWQETNRDQGHTYMCQGLMGTICQLAWIQGDDFFSYNDNMFLKACEYTAKYNYANLNVPNVPYTREYKGAWGTAYEEHPTISDRLIQDRPIWALVYYHYAKVKGVDAVKYRYTEMATNANAPEGGGGDYGGNSGGYDALGCGTLMYAR